VVHGVLLFFYSARIPKAVLAFGREIVTIFLLLPIFALRAKIGNNEA
jgi:hypothetical protein